MHTCLNTSKRIQKQICIIQQSKFEFNPFPPHPPPTNLSIPRALSNTITHTNLKDPTIQNTKQKLQTTQIPKRTLNPQNTQNKHKINPKYQKPAKIPKKNQNPKYSKPPKYPNPPIKAPNTHPCSVRSVP